MRPASPPTPLASADPVSPRSNLTEEAREALLSAVLLACNLAGHSNTTNADSAALIAAAATAFTAATRAA